MAANNKKGKVEFLPWTNATKVFYDAIGEVFSHILDLPVEKTMCLVQKSSVAGELQYLVPVGRVNRYKKLDKKAKYDQLAAEWAKKATEYLEAKPIKCLLRVFNDKAFVVFDVDKTLAAENVLKDIFSRRDAFGTLDVGNGRTVVVEYSSPNIAKPFHAGHLRSTIIGNFLKNLHEALGYKVIAINYLGDWGKQYGVLAIGFDKHGSEEKLKEDPIMHLFDVYVKINKDAEEDPTIHDKARAYFARMESGDPEALALWKKFRDLSIEKYKSIYARLGVTFDVYSGESQFGEEMEQVCKELEEKKLLEDDKGCKIINCKKEKLGNVLVRKSDGSTLYITRDIAAAISRYNEYKFDEMYYVVAAAQDHHFKQLFAVLKKMGHSFVNDCKHVNFGMVKGMSTRRGTVVFLEDILQDVSEQNLKLMKENEVKYKELEELSKENSEFSPALVSDRVGISAVVVQDLKAKRIKDYTFNWERMFQTQGDTGPYLQYAHVRMCSIERKCADITLTDQVDFSLLKEPAAVDLALFLAEYPIVLANAKATLEPSNVVMYAIKLSQLFSTAVEQLRVKGSPQPLAEARRLLMWCTKLVLSLALKLLGLHPLERM